MRKPFIFVLFVALLSLFASCNAPRTAADDFRDAILNKDFEKAAYLTEMQCVDKTLIVETYRWSYKDVSDFRIVEVNKTSDETAVADIEVVHGDSEKGYTEKGRLNLIKKEGKWLINY